MKICMPKVRKYGPLIWALTRLREILGTVWGTYRAYSRYKDPRVKGPYWEPMVSTFSRAPWRAALAFATPMALPNLMGAVKVMRDERKSGPRSQEIERRESGNIPGRS